MTQRHKHYDVIVAFAEGKRIQIKNGVSGEWLDWENDYAPLFMPDRKYRVKPDTLRYRVALFKHENSDKYYADTWNSGGVESMRDLEKEKNFVRWLTAVVEVPQL